MNGKDFDPSGNDGRIAIQPGVGTLIFARPIERDEGIYQCFAENEVGISVTVKIDLRLGSKWIQSTDSSSYVSQGIFSHPLPDALVHPQCLGCPSTFRKGLIV